MKSQLLILFFCFMVGFSWSQDQKTTRYVLAPSGLNFRETSDPGSAKIARMAYGDKVEWLAAPSSSEMLIDNIPGGMAKVKYKGKVGYAYDGYLSRYPAPKGEIEAEYYADFSEVIRMAGYDVLYEKINRDYGGYYQYEEALVIGGTDLMDGYLLARQLFEIPPKLHLPKPSSKKEEIVVNPEKPEPAWSDDMTVKRNSSGEIVEIWYGYRAEATGKSVVISHSDEMREHIRISIVFIAD